MSSSILIPVDPRLRGFGAAPEPADSIDLFTEPASSAVGHDLFAEPSAEPSAEPTAEPIAEPSALSASQAVTLERVQPKAPGLDYTSKALYVDSLAGYYGVFPPRIRPQIFV
jgi:hypothetical protein